MIEKASISDYDTLLDIWNSAVSATHNFLKEEDFLYYKSQIPIYFSYVDLYIYRDTDNIVKGFLGVSEDKIEMLFIHNTYRGQGIGKNLLMFAINSLHLEKVDVNEENKQALDFYINFGFKQIGYSETDSEGKFYPIIFMQL